MSLESEQGIRIKGSVRWFSAKSFSFTTPNDGWHQSGIKSKGFHITGEVLKCDVYPQTKPPSKVVSIIASCICGAPVQGSSNNFGSDEHCSEGFEHVRNS